MAFAAGWARRSSARRASRARRAGATCWCWCVPAAGSTSTSAHCAMPASRAAVRARAGCSIRSRCSTWSRCCASSSRRMTGWRSRMCCARRCFRWRMQTWSRSCRSVRCRQRTAACRPAHRATCTAGCANALRQRTPVPLSGARPSCSSAGSGWPGPARSTTCSTPSTSRPTCWRVTARPCRWLQAHRSKPTCWR